MKHLLVIGLIALSFCVSCQQSDDTNYPINHIKNNKKISKIKQYHPVTLPYSHLQVDSLLFEYNDNRIICISTGENNYCSTLEYNSKSVICHIYNTFIDLWEGSYTYYLNTKGFVDHSNDNQFTYDSNGFLIKDALYDYEIKDRNTVKKVTNSKYLEMSNYQLHTEIEYYLDTLNTNRFYQDFSYNCYVFTGLFGEPNKNLIKTITTRMDDEALVLQQNYTYELDNENLIRKIHIVENILHNTANTYDYEIYY